MAKIAWLLAWSDMLPRLSPCPHEVGRVTSRETLRKRLIEAALGVIVM